MAGDALTFRVAFVVRWLLWVVRFVVIWPLATMALMALFVLWKDNTTPGQLLVQEIDFVRQTAPAGQFPVRECLPSLHDLPGAEEKICHYRNVGATEYARETDRSLMQLATAFWATLALMYMSFAAGTGKYPMWPGKMKCVRVAAADERLKEVLSEDTSLPGKIRKCHVYFPDDRAIRNNGDKNEHA
ncbi:TPA: conjugal transfer pilus-stabilizing protein TraP [Escherichia coli]|uniref:conjugal transfer pilus-stabilizing protein TraP n=2 Tax=Escherichia coli TaxID=562 RepID=UPI000DA42E86|nr:conjugal transfer pilus-stabilizing protein TraP [Escherichia coli]MCK2513038.1 conjugal transfer protein TraP [Escherichia coli]MCK3146581.1 conjugal transfer protein TraP [Escherichia coli]MCZ7340637.1 conjugal transfer protein TraP [Escherichia coli]MDS1709160.1 conjugal transfer pilus-stabilizing protein TraP [Escherichia coli]MDS1764548.1 conjugal transfer pilus-stabilizing protein TraP [Escherichia coli]